MHQISLNIVQIICLLLFACVFAYYWTPRNNNQAEEYLKLLDDYNAVKSRLKRLQHKQRQEIYVNDSTMGSAVSAHTGAVRPGSGNISHDNIISEMVP